MKSRSRAGRPGHFFKKPDLMNITERIVSHAIELFIRSGIKAITMDDISAAAGVSKRTIYENFRDKDELLRACLLFMDNIHARETERIFSESTNTIDLVLRFLKHGIEAINSINPLFMTDMKKYHYRIWKETYIINSDKYLSQTFTILKKGINEGLFRRNIDVDIVARLLNEQLTLMTDERIFPSFKYSKSVVFENIIINFFRGISTGKGLEIIDKSMEQADYPQPAAETEN
jgi:TetR/AcrR family transcriptional regulator, cholesterol catabolism regulator